MRAYLLLEDGHVFEGESFGAVGETVGELVFTTGVVGYVETMTDPACCGQIAVFTFPTLGNYGWIEEDAESAHCTMRGVVVREWCAQPSNFRAGVTLDEYLRAEGVVGICGVDTRALTQIIREAGSMKAMISTVKPEGIPEALRSADLTGAAAAVGRKEKQVFAPQGRCCCEVALLDYGAKKSLIESLLSLGCRVTALPWDTGAEEILALAPDGILLSDGPGDPAELPACADTVRALLGKKPMFGIGLGHLLLALAAGGSVARLGHGHHGANQPVRDCTSGRVRITAQHHGFAVSADAPERFGAVLSHVNVNDGSCEGLDYPGKNAFSLQFQPALRPDRPEPDFGFEKFVAMMGGKTVCR